LLIRSSCLRCLPFFLLSPLVVKVRRTFWSSISFIAHITKSSRRTIHHRSWLGQQRRMQDSPAGDGRFAALLRLILLVLSRVVRWMDNWVSQVYGRKRTKRVTSAKIIHLTQSHGTRYGGFWEIGQYMRGEIIRGRAMVEEFLSHTAGMADVLESYRADIFSYHTR
jgi:hypothetical protein